MISSIQIWHQHWRVFQIHAVFVILAPFVQAVLLQWRNSRHLGDEVTEEHWTQDGKIFPVNCKEKM